MGDLATPPLWTVSQDQSLSELVVQGAALGLGQHFITNTSLRTLWVPLLTSLLAYFLPSGPLCASDEGLTVPSSLKVSHTEATYDLRSPRPPSRPSLPHVRTWSSTAPPPPQVPAGLPSVRGGRDVLGHPGQGLKKSCKALMETVFGHLFRVEPAALKEV